MVLYIKVKVFFMSTRNSLERKLAILRNGSIPVNGGSDPESSKDRDERKKFWSEVMDTAEKTGDRLKASELLGRSEADFTDKIGLGAVDGDGEVVEIPLLFIRPTPLIDLDEE